MKTPSPSNWRKLARFAAPYRGRMAAVALVAFVGALVEAAFLVLLTSAVLALASGGSTVGPWMGVLLTLDQALLLSLAAVIGRLMFGLAGARLTASLVAHVTSDQRNRLARAFLGTTWAIQQEEPSGRLQAILTTFVSQITGTMTNLTSALTSTLSLIAFMGTGFFVDPLAAGAVLIALGVLGTVLAPLRRMVRARSREFLDANLSFAHAIAELGALGQEMHTFGVRNQFGAVVGSLSDSTTEAQRRVQVLNGSMTPVYTALAYFAVVAGIGALTRLGAGDLTAVGAVMLLMLRSLSYGQQLVSVAGALAASIPFLDEVDRTFARYDSQRAPAGSLTPAQVTPIAVRDVSFGYDDDRVALSHITLTIDSGASIGVIGPSGAGKSTFAQLLLGLRPPSSGRIMIADTDLAEVDRDWWASRVAFVPQDPLLITGTVAENLRFFRDGYDDAALRLAASQANILDEINDLPQGFATHLGERASQLSGGQRQRLSIARALLGRPDLIILDEPTSALDGRSELLIRQALDGLRGTVTVVTIAHRMSTLDACDKILVIERGEITGWDSPSALRNRNHFYQRALESASVHTSPSETDLP